MPLGLALPLALGSRRPQTLDGLPDLSQIAHRPTHQRRIAAPPQYRLDGLSDKGILGVQRFSPSDPCTGKPLRPRVHPTPEGSTLGQGWVTTGQQNRQLMGLQTPGRL